MLLRPAVDVDTTQTLASLEAARAILRAATAPLGVEQVTIAAAVGRVLGADVLAVADLPAWPNSALDGFAVRARDAERGLPIAFEVTAGNDPGALPEEHVAAIATGGILPVGADAVVPIERATIDDGGLVRADGPVAPGNGVRGVGADVSVGATIAVAAQRVTPLLAAAIAAAGHGTASCVRRPRAVVLVTGDELVAPGTSLRRGQVHDSNSLLIAGTLEAFGCVVVQVRNVPDSLAATTRVAADALAHADIVVSSGGVSVGPRDHVKPALASLGVEQLFWRVAIQPGKPVWAGRAPAGAIVVGLPGNPLSTLVGLHLIVATVVRALVGGPEPDPVFAALAEPVRRLPGRTRALPARVTGGRALAVAEGSHQIARAATSNGLVLIDAGVGFVETGTTVPVVSLDGR